MAYIDTEKVVKAKNEIVERMQVFINEYKQYSESTVDYHYGRVDGLEVARRLVKSILTDLTEQPTADVEEVKHGEWIGVADYGNGNCIGYCSVCGTTHKAENASELKCFQRYCRWCGAKMDGGNAE